MPSSNPDERPTIDCSENGPYIVKNLPALTNSKGESIPTKPTVALCRCGRSARKPFCDGTHAKIGFSDEKLPGRTPDRRDNYVGRQIAIHDNRGVCSHAGLCRLATVFRANIEPWIVPDGADVQEIIDTVKQCPSGALSYSVGGVEDRDQERPPEILVSENGPYQVVGGVELKAVPRGEGASSEHYTLCRCGASKNKPFCDGTHWNVEFTDDQN